MYPNLLLRVTAVVVMLAASAWIVLGGSSVSAQTTGTDAIKMFDQDGDGSIDLKEAKAAAAAEFDKMDKDHEGTVDNEELGGRVTLLDQQLQEGRFRFWKIRAHSRRISTSSSPKPSSKLLIPTTMVPSMPRSSNPKPGKTC